jgi:O-antigen ligase
VLWVRAAIALSILLFVPGLIEQFEAPKIAAVRVCGFGALALALAGAARRPRPSWTPLDFAVAAWLVVEVVATVFAVSPRLALFGEPDQREGLLTSIALAGIYVAARGAIRDPRRAAGILDLALAAAAIACVYALLQAARLDPLRWTRTALYGTTLVRPFGTLGHPNLLGVVTAAATAVALARAVRVPDRRWIYGPAAALLAATTVLTFSRGAWLAMIAGTGATALLLWRAAPVSRVSRRAWTLAAAALAALAVLFVAGGWGRLFAERFGELGSGAFGRSGGSRMEIWSTAWNAWQARPWIGHGPDTFSLVFPRHQTPEYWRFEWGGLPDHAHSIYLHTLATRGVAGALVMALALAALVVAARAAWRAGDEQRGLVGALAGVFTALLVAGAFGALGISGALLGVVGAAMTVNLVKGEVAGSGPAGRPSRNAWLAGVVTALVVAGWSGVELAASRAARVATYWLQASPTHAALAAARAQALVPFDDSTARLLAQAQLGVAAREPGLARVVEAESAARRAVALEPLRSLNHLRLGAVLAVRASTGDTAALRQTEAEFGKAVELAPVDGIAMVEAARFQIWLRRPAQAVALARRAAALYPEQSLVNQVLAVALLETGDREGARAALERALAGDWRGLEAEQSRARRLLDSLR